ncbi:MAG TPA: pitrilysin family protein, partial [Candidatus Krumholzibacterium sp.]|nr:pitrilysin family protein [Candidatus Krumholzibacterium sp.]
AVVGDVDAGKAIKLIRKKFGAWSGARKTGADYPPVERKTFPGRRVIVIDKPDVTQSQIRIGNLGVPMSTPDYFPLEVANTILGGGFTSRLMDEIRVNRGLSYGARSRMVKYRHGGYFGVYTYTKNESLRECVDVALGEIDKMRDIAIEQDELEGAERYISGLFPFELETNSDLARWMMNVAFYGLGEDFVENYRSRIDAVSSEDVQGVAREYFHSSDNVIVLLTNYEETAAQLEGLGTIEVIKIDDVR